MNSVVYRNLPVYLQSSNYIININDSNNITNSTGLSPIGTLQTAVSNIQKMVDYSKKQINVNFISNYDTTPIQVLANLNLSNVDLLQNGSVFVSGSGGSSSYISSGNTYIAVSATSNVNQVAIEFNTGNSTSMTITQGGNVALDYKDAGVGKFLECIDLSGTAQWMYVSTMQNSIASLKLINGVFSFQENEVEVASVDSTGRLTAQDFLSVSDKRYKKNISTIINAGEILKKLRGVRFDWRKDDSHDIGVIAQEVFEVMPEAIISTTNQTLTVSYNKIIPILLETIKDLQNRVELLELKP